MLPLLLAALQGGGGLLASAGGAGGAGGLLQGAGSGIASSMNFPFLQGAAPMAPTQILRGDTMNLNRIGLLDDKENPLVNPQSALAQYQPQQVATTPLPPIEYARPAQIQHIQIGGKYKRRF